MSTTQENELLGNSYYGDGIELRVYDDMLLHVAFGKMTVADSMMTFQFSERIAAKYGYVLVLVDSSRDGSATAEARKHQVDTLRKRIIPSQTAVFGINAVSRATITLMVRAVELVTGKRLCLEIASDEAAARRILDKARVRFQAARQAQELSKTSQH